MPAPFYPNVAGITAAAPGAGAFTPSAAAPGALAWSTVPAGWIGLVRFDDGTAWELSYCYWSAGALTRQATAFVASSTGAALALTDAAIASLVIDPAEMMPHMGSTPQRFLIPLPGGTAFTQVGMPLPATVGTLAAGPLASTSQVNENVGIQFTSALTINSQVGHWNTNTFAFATNLTGRGGVEYTERFGFSQLPTTAFRVFKGLSSVAINANTTDPSTVAGHVVALAKNAADANLQFMTNNAGAIASKVDTGIPLVAGGLYEVKVGVEPGNARAYILLVRLDTGAVFYRTTTNQMPNGFMAQYNLATLSVAATVALVMRVMSVGMRTGA